MQAKTSKSPNMYPSFMYIPSIFHYIDTYCKPKQSSIPNIYAYTWYDSYVLRRKSISRNPHPQNTPQKTLELVLLVSVKHPLPPCVELTKSSPGWFHEQEIRPETFSG